MGLRSLVALPVDKGGSVVRFTLESVSEANTDYLITSVAYGISADQTLLLGLPYRIEPDDQDRTGGLSILYRHISWREDRRDWCSSILKIVTKSTAICCIASVKMTDSTALVTTFPGNTVYAPPGGPPRG
jgi:hypothetical protein